MSSTLPRVGVWTIAREDVRALPRNVFALAAVGVVLALFVPVASFAFAEGAGDALFFTWLIGELVVAIVVAARVAAVRRNRFVDSLYTTPLDQARWFVAQALVGALLALIVLAVQLPFLAVHMAFLGMPPELPVLLVGALGMAAFAVALGLFCGAIVGNAGSGPASGMAGGIGFLSFLLFIFHGLTVTGPPTATQPVLLRLTALSPLTLVTAATGIDIFGVAPAALWRPALGLVAMVAGLAAAAWWTYTRAQGPLGWESRGGRSIVVALVALAVVGPVAAAEVDFVAVEDEDDFVFSGGEHTQVAFVARGAPIGERSFTLSEILDAPDLPLGEDVEMDALVLLLAPEGATVRGVRIAVQGSDAVRVVEGGILIAPNGRPSGHAPAGEGWDSVSEGPPKPVHRVPVTLRAVSVEALSDSPALVQVRTEFLASGTPMTSLARITLDGEIEGGSAMLALAGAPLPLAALSTVVVRKLRTR